MLRSKGPRIRIPAGWTLMDNRSEKNRSLGSNTHGRFPVVERNARPHFAGQPARRVGFSEDYRWGNQVHEAVAGERWYATTIPRSC